MNRRTNCRNRKMMPNRMPNTPLSIISTKPKLSDLSYENIVNHYLDEDSHTRGHFHR